jgi:hypothetical protein
LILLSIESPSSTSSIPYNRIPGFYRQETVRK